MAQGRKTGGRKKGTPNKANALIRSAIEKADPIAFLICVMNGSVPSKNKDSTFDEGGSETPSPAERIRAAEFLAKRIAPELREQPIAFDLGPIGSPKEAVAAMSRIAEALAKGDLLPTEAKAMNESLSNYLKGFETGELAERLDALEAKLNERHAA